MAHPSSLVWWFLLEPRGTSDQSPSNGNHNVRYEGPPSLWASTSVCGYRPPKHGACPSIGVTVRSSLDWLTLAVDARSLVGVGAHLLARLYGVLAAIAPAYAPVAAARPAPTRSMPRNTRQQQQQQQRQHIQQSRTREG